MKGTQGQWWTVQLDFGDGDMGNPHINPTAIPETGGDISFLKKTQAKKNSNVTHGVKARHFGARTGCQFGATPMLLTMRSRRLGTWRGARKA